MARRCEYMRKMGTPASGTQNTKCTMPHSVCSKAASSFGKSFVHGAENYMTVTLLTGWLSNLPVLFRMNQELDWVLDADRLHPVFYSP